jgi:hypothetical protein
VDNFLRHNRGDGDDEVRSARIMSTPMQLSYAKDASGAFASQLAEGRQRYLAQAIAHAFSVGRRSSEDFLRHFPPRAIMAALADQPRLRANIMVPTIGTHERVALKKSADSAGEDLQIALDEGVTDGEAILALFDPDDQVRHIEERRLWAFLVEGEFWRTAPASGNDFVVAKQHIAFLIERARENGLLTDRDFVEACTLDAIVEHLPKPELAMLLRASLAGGREGKPFDDHALLAVHPPAVLLEHLPLDHVWERVVAAKIAIPNGFAAKIGPGILDAAIPPPPPNVEEEEPILIEVDRVSAHSG